MGAAYRVAKRQLRRAGIEAVLLQLVVSGRPRELYGETEVALISVSCKKSCVVNSVSTEPDEQSVRIMT